MLRSMLFAVVLGFTCEHRENIIKTHAQQQVSARKLQRGLKESASRQMLSPELAAGN